MKMKVLSYIVVAFLVTFFVGCGSIYNYKVEPTPIKKGESKFTIEEFNLKLTHGHGYNIENKTFKNEEELKSSFVQFINQKLKEKNLLGSAENSYKVKINMNYERRYNYGGNALNKPYFYYSIDILDSNQKLLVSYSVPLSTTKYSYAKDIAVNLEIAAFQWDAEDEPIDIDMIAFVIVRELSEVGK
ncbi:hypothetical protein O8C80_00050 [Aliarcobacter butzleri]|uniref:hypothetical protein n=1 Tax=Aliarcobacter butzleri TaxID=28197 RepID=UPI00263E0714|nr:hypothetical protein [Aliarcobacter butzleri]MDN5041709.1 hypothetical protein [Aliarcobacter butzleri]